MYEAWRTMHSNIFGSNVFREENDSCFNKACESKKYQNSDGDFILQKLFNFIQTLTFFVKIFYKKYIKV